MKSTFTFFCTLCLLLFIHFVSAQPVISAFSPTSGPIGMSVVISGSNFSTTPANNIVYTGGVKAPVSLASSTSLTITIPAGATYLPITVTTNGLTAYAAQPFNVTFPGGGVITATSFANRLNFQLTAARTEPISSDLDGDGKAELLFLYPNRVVVFRNTSSGGNISFGGEQSFSTSCPFGFSLGDIDGDGKPDIVASDQCNSMISIQKNTSTSGSISFAAKQDIPTTSEGFPYKVEVGDFDGDGKPDIATVNLLGFTFSVFRNTSIGGIISFAPKIDYSTGAFPRNLVLADLNKDGKTDVIVANQGSQSISVFENGSTNGNIFFNSRSDYSTTAGSSPEHVSAADFDGDGMIDLAVTNNNNPGTLSVFRNLVTSGSTNIFFSSKTDFELGAGTFPYSLAVADLDGDGKPDAAVSNQSLGALSVLRNTSTTGNISFAPKVDFAAGSVGRKHLSSIDVNADGKPDLVLADDNTNNTAVYVNKVGEPNIMSFTPVAAGTNSVVTITGTNFIGTTAVRFGGTDAASFNVVNATTINAVVGSGASGDVTVTSPLGTGILSGFTFTGAVNPIPAITALYWVGASNSNWNNSNNWSSTAGGPGGAGVPGSTDSVIILYEPGLNINMDVSTTIGSLTVTKSSPGGDTYSQKVTLYTGSKTTLTILNSLFIYSANLVDSTTEDVSFKLILSGAKQATGSIGNGAMTFAGRVPVTNGHGATLVAEPGSKLTVRSGGSIYSCANSAYIECDPTSLDFSLQSSFIMKSNPDASIPNATFEPDYVQYANVPYNPPPVVLTIPGASIIIDGKLDKIKYPNPRAQFRALYVNLNEQDKDATLALPDSSSFNSLFINNSNGYTLTLLGNGNGSSSMFLSTGNFYINGSTTKVALATATASVPSISYRFQTAFYTQTAGNFSLQDFDGATGPSTLAISRDLVQSGGTFFTNSSSTNSNAEFVLEMNGGDFVYSRSYMGYLSNGQSITMSSGNIDNGKRNVIFRVNTPLIPYNGYVYDDKGVFLKSPLSVFRLELLKGSLNTTSENIITINDRDAAKSITTGNYAESFIAGPFRRLTNSTASYVTPTGAKGYQHIYDFFRPFTITPSSVAPSVYQISYLNNSYADLNVMAPLKGVSDVEFWTVDKLSGADAIVKLPFYKVINGSSSIDEVVVAQYKDGSWRPANGTKLPPGAKDSTLVESKLLTSYGAFTLGYGVIGSDTVISGATCGRDTTIYADPATCKATVNWSLPADFFADTYNIGTGDKLRFKGAFNGHGYYISEGNYNWETAKIAAANAGGHLVTITSATENNFILNNLVDPQRQELIWIGLRNTGKSGQFGWITGEPLSYTYWKPGEPNNYYNDPTSNDIIEPYVHINGYEGNKWNDIGFASSRFIAEFDSALVSYRQYSGPENGSMLPPGVYTVCYERTDHQTGKRDSCCFNITVACTSNNNGAESSRRDKFDVTAYPNPTTSSFKLRLAGIASDEEVRMEVTDAFGRVLEVREHLVVKNVLRFGHTYRPGMYFAKITKGKKVITIKLIKQ